MTNRSNISIIITAAGSSTRMGSGVKKEYLPFNHGTVLTGCAKTFLNACLENPQVYICDFVVTCPAGGVEECKNILQNDEQLQTILVNHKMNRKNFIKIVEGGDSRQKSVFNALQSLKKITDIVLIHDGARPFVTERIINEGISAALQFGASVPGITPTDTQKQIDDNGFIVEHLVRSKLTAVQTPQCFRFEQLLEAHKRALLDNKEYTDDTEVWGKYNPEMPVKVIQGDINNIKITYPLDLQKLQKADL